MIITVLMEIPDGQYEEVAEWLKGHMPDHIQVMEVHPDDLITDDD